MRTLRQESTWRTIEGRADAVPWSAQKCIFPEYIEEEVGRMLEACFEHWHPGGGSMLSGIAEGSAGIAGAPSTPPGGLPRCPMPGGFMVGVAGGQFNHHVVDFVRHHVWRAGCARPAHQLQPRVRGSSLAPQSDTPN